MVRREGEQADGHNKGVKCFSNHHREHAASEGLVLASYLVHLHVIPAITNMRLLVCVSLTLQQWILGLETDTKQTALFIIGYWTVRKNF